MDAERNLRVLNLIRAEFTEMPGLTLKTEQVQRLCGVERGTCDEVLRRLVDLGFLALRSDGSYARSKNADIARLRPTKAHLPDEWTRRTGRALRIPA